MIAKNILLLLFAASMVYSSSFYRVVDEKANTRQVLAVIDNVSAIGCQLKCNVNSKCLEAGIDEGLQRCYLLQQNQTKSLPDKEIGLKILKEEIQIKPTDALPSTKQQPTTKPKLACDKKNLGFTLRYVKHTSKIPSVTKEIPAITDFSFFFWLWMEDIHVGRQIFSLRNKRGCNWFHFRMESREGFLVYTPFVSKSFRTAIRNDKWTHIGMTFSSGTGIIQFFVNGIYAQEAMIQPPDKLGIEKGDLTIYLGTRLRDCTTVEESFTGKISGFYMTTQADQTHIINAHNGDIEKEKVLFAWSDFQKLSLIDHIEEELPPFC